MFFDRENRNKVDISFHIPFSQTGAFGFTINGQKSVYIISSGLTNKTWKH